VEVSVTPSGNGKSSEAVYMPEKYFLPPVPPAKLETPNTLNMELTK